MQAFTLVLRHFWYLAAIIATGVLLYQLGLVVSAKFAHVALPAL